MSRRINVLRRAPAFKALLNSCLFRPAMMLITLFFFTLAILTGLFGTPAGNRNFGIVFTPEET